MLYKIYAKVLQIHFQKLLPKIYHEEQGAFLSSRYIVDAALVEHETVASAGETNQPLII